MPQSFAVNGNNLAIGRFPQVMTPRHHELHELIGTKDGKDPPQGIVRGNPELQRKKLAKPVDPLLGKLLDLGPAITVSDRTAKRDEQHFEEFVSCAALDSWIGNFFQTCN